MVLGVFISLMMATAVVSFTVSTTAYQPQLLRGLLVFYNLLAYRGAPFYFGAYPFHTHSIAWGRNCTFALRTPCPES